MRTIVAGLAVGVLATSSAFAQSVISAHSGVIHYTEGKILVNDKVYESKTSEFGDLKDNSILKTEEGRAEVLLTPGVFLRLGENSSIRMVSNHLSDTRVEVLSGETLVECDELLKDNQVTLLYKDATVALVKHGLYRFDTPPGRVRVYDGEAIVHNGSGQLTAKKGNEVMLDGALMASKFDTKSGDELMRWASRRSGYLSMANVASARSAGSYGSSYSGGWAFNPYFGMYTFIPMNGITFSPFGYPFWSPYAAFMYAPYYPGYYYGGGYVYSPTNSSSGFHPTPRSGGSNLYSASGTARSVGGIGSGGVAGRGDRGGGSYTGNLGGYSGGTNSAASGTGGYTGGGVGSAAVSSGAMSGGGHAGGGGGAAAGGGHR